MEIAILAIVSTSLFLSVSALALGILSALIK